MKRIIFLTLLSVVIGCSPEEKCEEIVRYEGPIAGKWQLVAIFDWDGTTNFPQWYEVEEENSYTYTFKKNGEFLKSDAGDCSTGIYIVDPDYIIFDYDCDPYLGDDPPGVIKEEYEFSSGFLILTPSYLNCAEGCGWKYKKIEDF